jgi:hypothetical protein
MICLLIWTQRSLGRPADHRGYDVGFRLGSGWCQTRCISVSSIMPLGRPSDQNWLEDAWLWSTLWSSNMAGKSKVPQVDTSSVFVRKTCVIVLSQRWQFRLWQFRHLPTLEVNRQGSVLDVSFDLQIRFFWLRAMAFLHRIRCNMQVVHARHVSKFWRSGDCKCTCWSPGFDWQWMTMDSGSLLRGMFIFRVCVLFVPLILLLCGQICKESSHPRGARKSEWFDGETRRAGTTSRSFLRRKQNRVAGNPMKPVAFVEMYIHVPHLSKEV